MVSKKKFDKKNAQRFEVVYQDAEGLRLSFQAGLRPIPEDGSAERPARPGMPHIPHFTSFFEK